MHSNGRSLVGRVARIEAQAERPNPGVRLFWHDGTAYPAGELVEHDPNATVIRLRWPDAPA